MNGLFERGIFIIDVKMFLGWKIKIKCIEKLSMFVKCMRYDCGNIYDVL